MLTHFMQAVDGYEKLWNERTPFASAWAMLTFSLGFGWAWYNDGWMLFWALTSVTASAVVAYWMGAK